jgi:glycosyltransferase involved in cell wall biosynthesis
VKKVVRAGNVGARQAWLWRNRFAFGRPGPGHRSRLLVDVSAILCHDAQTGIQRVVRAVWSELHERRDAGFETVPVYATSTHGYCYAPFDFLERGARILPAEPVSVRQGDKFLGLDLSAHLLPKYRRQLRSWRAYGASIHIVVYDLLPLLRPEWFTSAASSHFRKWYDVLQQHADQAICISDQVARDLRERLHATAAQGRVSIGRLKMGADIAGSLPSAGLCPEAKQLLEHLRFKPAILMVGTIEPRKGYDAALAAFEYLWRNRPDEAPELVIVGKPGWKSTELEAKLRSHPEAGRRLHWFDRMSDEGLCLLYDSCRGVLMASRGEGFGLPLIEAAMHRRHVLARDLAVFREQRFPNVGYFSDDRPEPLGDRLVELAALGKQQAPLPANLPTWSDSVDGLLRELGLVETRFVEPLRKAS